MYILKNKSPKVIHTGVEFREHWLLFSMRFYHRKFAHGLNFLSKDITFIVNHMDLKPNI